MGVVGSVGLSYFFRGNFKVLLLALMSLFVCCVFHERNLTCLISLFQFHSNTKARSQISLFKSNFKQSYAPLQTKFLRKQEVRHIEERI